MVSNAELARGVWQVARYVVLKSHQAILRNAADCLEADAVTLEECAEIGAEISVGLAWASGDAEPPKTCSEGCKSPHLGPRAHQAIADGLRALREGTWNPPGREGP